ncbi:MAG: uracil-DNA glycosylase [Burkholderiales bacterium]
MLKHVPDFKYLGESFASLNPEWQNFLLTNCASELLAIDKQLEELAYNQAIYPPKPLIFNALQHTPLSQVKVVILGQDPYHGQGQANGLAFAVFDGVKLPPSLRNIYKELSLEYGVDTRHFSGEQLLKWADQGVLLLNASLTVLENQANSLAKIGWHNITDKIIAAVSDHCQHVVFMLWGNYARQKTALIDPSQHLILQGVHPSPLSAGRGFFGCNHFQLANQYLAKHDITPIKWV